MWIKLRNGDKRRRQEGIIGSEKEGDTNFVEQQSVCRELELDLGLGFALVSLH